ncbi:MAG: cytochrome c family protein [Pelagibacterales bacterium]|nr:cytochrome c family protein [Pelagibacterales bacterium]MBT7076174.1 cytochrome c family protein [Pelagibacterales bacterium]
MEVHQMLKFLIKSISVIFLLSYVHSAQAGDAAAGKKVFNKCKACHGIDEGGKNKLGPNLWNIVGSPIAAKEGYKYSKGMIAYAGEAGNWNDENLDIWLKKPKDLVRKTKMIFPGLKKEADRQNIIAYLKANGQ